MDILINWAGSEAEPLRPPLQQLGDPKSFTIQKGGHYLSKETKSSTVSVASDMS
jgi:hypothetical protein